jgi:hypothetical protein
MGVIDAGHTVGAVGVTRDPPGRVTPTTADEEGQMTLSIDTTWITSDRCPQVAMFMRIGWVLSWRNGRYDRGQAIAAMERAESGDLTTDPASLPRRSTPPGNT